VDRASGRGAAVAFMTSTSGADRVEGALAWLASRRGSDVLVVGASAEAVDGLVRRSIGLDGARVGVHRTTLEGLALRLALRPLARAGLVPLGTTALEAVAARVLASGPRAEAPGPASLRVASPGMPRALVSTLGELALEEIAPDALRPFAPVLAGWYDGYLAALAAHGHTDRAGLLGCAAEVARAGAGHPWLGVPVLFLDVPVRHAREASLVRAVLERAPAGLVLHHPADAATRACLDPEGVRPALALPRAAVAPGLRALQERLFAPEHGASAPEAPGPTEAVELAARHGDEHDATEVARGVLSAVQRGVRFDRIAVLLRAPARARPLLEEAFERAEIPARHARGARRPDPSGRALSALLACAAEGLSARGFCEYLSLGVWPLDAGVTKPSAPPVRTHFSFDDDDGADDDPDDSDEDDDDHAPGRGAVRSFERWIVASHVHAGRARWHRRLAEQLEIERAASAAAGPDEAARRARRVLELEALIAFSCPIIDALDALPEGGTWGAWIEALGALAARALRAPSRVLAVLGQLAPMSSLGPVGLDEVRTVLGPKLGELERRGPVDGTHGAVWVGGIDDARGRDFDVVFVPGVAERVFPARFQEDPLLPDALRAQISPRLRTRTSSAFEERTRLALAAGAPRHRLHVSFPRLDPEGTRVRLPSFYVLELARALEGRMPSLESLSHSPPAAASPGAAIDAAEYDLRTFDAWFSEPRAVRAGALGYLLDEAPAFARATRAHWARWDARRWRPQDGMVEPDPAALAVLGDHLPSRRATSATALEAFSACPYQFFLRSVVRLEPRPVEASAGRLDPAQRGALMHDVQARFLTRLRAANALPIAAEALPDALGELDAVLAEVLESHVERAPTPASGVWAEACRQMRSDLRGWVAQVAAERAWVPAQFELAFGLPPGGVRDPASVPDPVALGAGLLLRGAIDVVERGALGWRATDLKTGAAPEARSGQRVAGGQRLQPLLYALALEALRPGETVWGGRLFYGTERGGYTSVEVPLDAVGRAAIATVVGTVDEALRTGFLPAAPTEKACGQCGFRRVCGPSERLRTARKQGDRLVPLDSLRRLP